MIRTSQAFAARREVIILGLQQALSEDLVPHFNAECFDIRKKYDETIEFTKDMEDGPAKTKLIELAESNRKARIFDLNLRKRQFIDGLNVDMKMQCKSWLNDYKGEEFEEREPLKSGATHRDGNPRMRTVLKAKFPDGSQAKIPQQLYIDPRLFDRV